MMMRRSFKGVPAGVAVGATSLFVAGSAVAAMMAKFDPALGPCDPSSPAGMTCDMRHQVPAPTAAPTANVAAYVGTISAKDTAAPDQTIFAASVASEGTPPTYTQKVSVIGSVKNACGNWTSVDLDGIPGTVLPAQSNHLMVDLALPNAMTFTAERTVSSKCADGKTSKNYTFKVEGRVEAPYLDVPPGGFSFAPPPGSTRFNIFTRGDRLSNAKVTYGSQTTTLSTSEDDYSKIEDFVEAYY